MGVYVDDLSVPREMLLDLRQLTPCAMLIQVIHCYPFLFRRLLSHLLTVPLHSSEDRVTVSISSPSPRSLVSARSLTRPHVSKHICGSYSSTAIGGESDPWG